jgi:hypothetical protein
MVGAAQLYTEDELFEAKSLAVNRFTVAAVRVVS